MRFMFRDLLAGNFLAHTVIFGDFMAGNFLAGDFLAGDFWHIMPLLETLWPETFLPETFWGGFVFMHKIRNP